MKNQQEISNIDEHFMTRALELARRGTGTTSPNPMVGSVVVKSGRIIGEGWHKKAGEPHAEPNAISRCSESVEGATVYVSLEPCCHAKKRTPPCSNLLIEKKVSRVVIACLDPNPRVAGKGVEQLEDAGIEVTVGILEHEAREINEVFFKNILQRKPFVHLKLAQTLDGKLSTNSGDSKWISNEVARKEVHELRLKYDGVMVGRSTLNNDNPSLSIRMGVDNKGKTPWKIIVGSSEKLDFGTSLLSTDKEKTILITDKEVEGFICILEPIEKALGELFKRGICSLLIEGGAQLASTILEKNLADKLTVYISPKIIGEGKSYFQKENELMSQAINLEEATLRSIGNQAVYEVNLCSQA